MLLRCYIYPNTYKYIFWRLKRVSERKCLFYYFRHTNPDGTNISRKITKKTGNGNAEHMYVWLFEKRFSKDNNPSEALFLKTFVACLSVVWKPGSKMAASSCHCWQWKIIKKWTLVSIHTCIFSVARERKKDYMSLLILSKQMTQDYSQ